jgi:hypothetical protein
VKEALMLDKLTGTTFWRDAMQAEIDQLLKFKTFNILAKGVKTFPGMEKYTYVPMHFVFDVKFVLPVAIGPIQQMQIFILVSCRWNRYAWVCLPRCTMVYYYVLPMLVMLFYMDLQKSWCIRLLDPNGENMPVVS